MDVLVTAVGGFGHGDQILKALQLAGPGQYRLHGADAALTCAQYGALESAHQLPKASDAGYLDALLTICQRHQIKALFHGCEPELKLFSQHRELLKSEGLFVPINPADVIDTCMDKNKTAAFLKGAGFEPPRTDLISDLSMVDQIASYPVVVKPSVGGGGSANCFIAQTKDELAALVRMAHSETSMANLLVQEYIGTPEDEYTVGVLHDMDGNFINSIGIRRALNNSLNVRTAVPNRTDRTDLGPRLVISSGISHGDVVKDRALLAQCEDIAKSLGAAGPVNVQCRFVDGKVRVFEINPRFSGTTSLRAMMGFNEPDILIRKHILGEDVPVGFEYKTGLVLRTLLETVITEDHQAIPFVRGAVGGSLGEG